MWIDIEYDSSDYSGLRIEEDGITHIRIDEDSKTELGRQLDFSFERPFTFMDVEHKSISAYYLWKHSDATINRQPLTLSEKMRPFLRCDRSDILEVVIKSFERNPHIYQMLAELELPVFMYYTAQINGYEIIKPNGNYDVYIDAIADALRLK